MMKCFFTLIIIYGIQQEVLSHTVNVEKRVHAFRHKLKRQIKEVQLKTQLDEPQEFMDNYDLIVGDSKEMRPKHPHLRSGHRHRNRKHRKRASNNGNSTTNFTLTTALIANSSAMSTTTSKTTPNNKSNDKSKTSTKNPKEKEKAATTSKTTANNKSNDKSKTSTKNPKEKEKAATTSKTTPNNKSNDKSKANTKNPKEKEKAATTIKTTANNKSNDKSKTSTKNPKEKEKATTTSKTTANNKNLKEKEKATTTSKTTANNKSNDSSKKKGKIVEEKVKAATTSKTTADNTIHDSFEKHVKILEEKVEAALTNLTNYLNPSDKGNIATTIFPPRRGNHKVSHRLPFYRRFNYLHDVERKKPQKWVHCLDLITPRLQGIKDDSRMNQMNHDSPDIRRLAQLLFTDVSQFNAEDMVSLLSQISKIRIRMYQWDQTAMTIILNVIIKGTEHSFSTLKAGIKELVSKWHLDLTNMQVFLEQTRIFRPPCIEITGHNGFTKKPGGVIPYTKPDKPKKKHDPNVSCKSREKHEPYDNNNP